MNDYEVCVSVSGLSAQYFICTIKILYSYQPFICNIKILSVPSSPDYRVTTKDNIKSITSISSKYCAPI